MNNIVMGRDLANHLPMARKTMIGVGINPPHRCPAVVYPRKKNPLTGGC